MHPHMRHCQFECASDSFASLSYVLELTSVHNTSNCDTVCIVCMLCMSDTSLECVKKKAVNSNTYALLGVIYCLEMAMKQSKGSGSSPAYVLYVSEAICISNPSCSTSGYTSLHDCYYKVAIHSLGP